MHDLWLCHEVELGDQQGTNAIAYVESGIRYEARLLECKSTI